MTKWGEVYNYGIVDLVLPCCHSCDQLNCIPVHQINKAPVVFLNLQPTERINYDHSTTGEWLAHCGACPVPEFANAFYLFDK
ncbi:hypothetical protein [Paenibacillus maysiensis]|uniref:hypothetical protein n=1 Tax=Paenibacillus maysiensis TaxID=1155954 RepID=UPI0012DFDC0E|nr:hypothetical protein [Paenibacillus maysiensis]